MLTNSYCYYLPRIAGSELPLPNNNMVRHLPSRTPHRCPLDRLEFGRQSAQTAAADGDIDGRLLGLFDVLLFDAHADWIP